MILLYELLKRIHPFISRNLPLVTDFGSIASAMEHTLLFGSSLGRVGLDFRASIATVFEDHILNIIIEKWDDVLLDIQENIALHLTSSTKNHATPIMISLKAINRRERPRTNESSNKEQQWDGDNYSDLGSVAAPPTTLMSFPILAEATNSLLDSFNDLR